LEGGETRGGALGKVMTGRVAECPLDPKSLLRFGNSISNSKTRGNYGNYATRKAGRFGYINLMDLFLLQARDEVISINKSLLGKLGS
jgi:hypothetical protein